MNITIDRKLLEDASQFNSVIRDAFSVVEFIRPENAGHYGEGNLLTQNIQRLYAFIAEDKENVIPIADTYQFKSFAMMIRIYDLDGFHFAVNSDKTQLYSYDILKERLDRYDRLASYNMEIEHTLELKCSDFLQQKTAALVQEFTDELSILAGELQLARLGLRSELYRLIYRSIIQGFFRFHKQFKIINSKDEVIYDAFALETSIQLQERYIKNRLDILEHTLDELHENNVPAHAIQSVKEFLSYHIDTFIHDDLRKHFYYNKTINPYTRLLKAFSERVQEKQSDAARDTALGDKDGTASAANSLAQAFTMNENVISGAGITIVERIIDGFKHQLENNELHKLLYERSNNTLKPEDTARRLFLSVAQLFCMANDLEVQPELDAAADRIVFRFSEGNTGTVTVTLHYDSRMTTIPGSVVQQDNDATVFHIVLNVTANDEKPAELLTVANINGDRDKVRVMDCRMKG